MVPYEKQYDVIVVGGGHAGCEAALAAARMGAAVLQLNLFLDNTAGMPCNPSIGGPAKGHLVREGNALGGEQAEAADRSAMLIRWLNTSKGPAVQALRAQCDLALYARHYILTLETQRNLEVRQEHVTSLWVDQGRVRGVGTALGTLYEGRTVVLATGTYLGGRAYLGVTSFPSGPMGQLPSLELTPDLIRHGIALRRMRTDTTPRLHLDTIDTAELTAQESAAVPLAFSLWNEGRVHSGYSCYLTRSNPATHDIIRKNLDRSPLSMGWMESAGPRYCPSIEDKVLRFPDRESHPVFLEPVSAGNREVYMQNFSTSLPLDVQIEMVRTLPGCSRAHIIRPGYAMEYDCLDPSQLTPSLEVRTVKGLFTAGPINGTSGYEEAAAQGLLAGINAALRVRGEDPLMLGRSDAYMGVLVDDLVTKGTSEPYRMLTSRCEHRLLLRHDNADRRLSPIGRRLGLLSDERWESLCARWKRIDDERARLENIRISPSEGLNDALGAVGSAPLSEPAMAAEILRRPHVSYAAVEQFLPGPSPLRGDEAHAVEVAVKYEGYVRRQHRQVARMRKLEDLRLPEDLSYHDIPGLLTESRQKLSAIRPRTLGQAGRISGVTPTDIHLVTVYLHAWNSSARSHEKKAE